MQVKCSTFSVASQSGFLFLSDPMRLTLILILVLLGTVQSAVAQRRGLQEVRVRWDTYIGSPAPQVVPQPAQPTTNAFTVERRWWLSGSLPRRRNSQLSENQLVIVALDAQGKRIDTQFIPDPRVLRAESPGPSGELRGEILHHATTELLITLPDDPSITELRIYHPRWNGSTFLLEPLGTINLP
jgi:hypothetical protein